MYLFKEIRRQCEEYGVSWWKLPEILLIMMAVVTIIIMLATYYWFSRHSEDTQLTVVFVAAEAISIMVIGNILVETSKDIISMNRLRKEFLDIMSHQMRTPATVIRWHMELLLKNKEQNLSERQLDHIRASAEANGKLISLLNDLLNMISVEQDKQQLNIARIDLLETVDSAIRNQQLFASSRDVSLVLRKGRIKNSWILADPIKFKVAIDNLLSNAIKFSRKRSEVSVLIKQNEDSWQCEIRDRGMGIKEDDKKYIFEKFYRSKDSQKLEIQGTGLGLYICKALLEKMEGKIWFTSKEGVGTTFYFTLPKA